jgi:hypothetical protein
MGSIFLRGNSWVGEYKDRGKIRRVTFGKKGVVTKTMAKEMLKKIEQKIKLGQYDMLWVEIPTLKGFANEYIKHVRDVVKKSSWWRDNYGLRHFVELFGNRVCWTDYYLNSTSRHDYKTFCCSVYLNLCCCTKLTEKPPSRPSCLTEDLI